MKRTIWFWLYFVIAIILAVYFSTRTVMIAMGHSTLSTIHGYKIDADQTKDLTSLSTAVAIAPGARAYAPDVLGQIRLRVLGVPGVKDVAVLRRPNGQLVIKARLYRAVALWTDGDGYFPLADDGTIVNRPVAERQPDTVLFRGTVPKNIAEITKAAHNLSDKLDYLEWIEGRRWNLHTTGGIVVMLPENDATGAIGSLIAMDQNHNILSKDIKVLDMRDTSRILIK